MRIVIFILFMLSLAIGFSLAATWIENLRLNRELIKCEFEHKGES